MGLPESEHNHRDLLRQRAEDALQGRPVDLAGLSPHDVQSLLHELQVHQVELSLQNEELRRVQLDLENARDRFSDLYNSAPVGFCTLDRKGRILEANQTLAVLLGVEHRALTQTTLSNFVTRADQDVYYLHRRRTFDTRQRQIREIGMVKPTGERWFARMESGMALGDGTRIQSVLSDVTDRRRVEEALGEAQARLRLALETAPISLYMTDRDLCYTWVDSTLYGLSPEALLGRRDDELFLPDHMAEITALKQAVVESGIGQRREVRLRVGDTILVHDVTVEPLSSDLDGVVGLRVASIDVTTLRRMEKAEQDLDMRRKLQQLLTEQREKERVQIARDLHDGPLQELLRTTFTLKDLLAHAHGNAEAEDLSQVLENVHQQINELRAFAVELRPPLLTSFGLPKAIQAHAGTLKVKQPGLTIHLQLEEEIPPLPEGIRLTLYRIYQEAASNILKHAQASEVWVRLKLKDKAVVLEIRDNGVGFTLPTQWLDLARGGHLGLVGIQERAEAVGGVLNIASRPGRGTTLQVSVPVMGDTLLRTDRPSQ